MTLSASLAIDEPTTFVTAKIFAPLLLDSLRAANVSAVSPDWEIKITRVFSSINGSLYLNSDAISVITGIFANFSIATLPTSPAWNAVPHATM